MFPTLFLSIMTCFRLTGSSFMRLTEQEVNKQLPVVLLLLLLLSPDRPPTLL